jgi:hypothetical protein
LTEAKIKKYEEIEKLIQNYDKKVVSGSMKKEEIENEEKIEVSNRPNQSKKEHKSAKPKSKGNNKNFSQKENNKNIKIPSLKSNQKQRKSKEEIDKEKKAKRKGRKALYEKLNKKTRYGQPVMKNKIEHLFNKIKQSINNN